MMAQIFTLLAGVDTSPLPNIGATSGRLQTILSIIFTTTGAIALLIITIAGFKYVASRGDPSSIASAKNTILYAVVGLLVSVTAFSIVNFVANGVG